MLQRIRRRLLFAAYQLTIALGIALLPVALVVNRAGITVPIGRLLEVVGDAYENA